MATKAELQAENDELKRKLEVLREDKAALMGKIASMRAILDS